MDEELERGVMTLKMLEALRLAIQRNGGLYSDGLVPNLRSIIDIQISPMPWLRQNLAGRPEFLVTPDETEQLRNGRFWAR